MKRILISLLVFCASISAHAQFSVIRGVNPSNAFVNLNADASGNIAVNCVTGCSGSSGIGGMAANGSAPVGNPVWIAGWDGANVRALNTDSSGHQQINVLSLPSIPTGANTIGAVTISGTPTVTVASTTLSGTSNNVLISPSTNTLVDKSGSITTGGASQTLSTAKSRHYFFVQNISTGNLYINFTSAASAASGSILIAPNSSFVMEGSFVSSELITIYGATTSQAFTAKEF